MGNFVFQDLNRFGQVWREGDPPLVNETEPSVEPEPESAAHTSGEKFPWGAAIVVVMSLVGLAALPAPRAPVLDLVCGVALALGYITILIIVRAWRRG